MPDSNHSLTPAHPTRYGPRHVVASRIIPSLTVSLRYLTSFSYREIFILFLFPSHSPVLSHSLQRGAPRVGRFSISFRSLRKTSRRFSAYDSCGIRLLTGHISYLPSYLCRLLPGVCTHPSMSSLLLSWKITNAYSARASCPTERVPRRIRHNPRLVLTVHRVYLRPRPPPPPLNV